jgi:hypothetical protein
MADLEKRHPIVAKAGRRVSSRWTTRATRELLAFAKRYFRRVDALRGDGA